MNPLPTPPFPATRAFCPLISFESVSLSYANHLLSAWGHKIGPLRRGNQGAWCHTLFHESQPVAVTTASYLIGPRVQGAPFLTRQNTIELSRIAADRASLCRVALRLWREFVFPDLPFDYAMSWQDAIQHTGNLYRFDGWKRVGVSRGRPDKRSGRPARDKYIWVWPAPTEASA